MSKDWWMDQKISSFTHRSGTPTGDKVANKRWEIIWLSYHYPQGVTFLAIRYIHQTWRRTLPLWTFFCGPLYVFEYVFIYFNQRTHFLIYSYNFHNSDYFRWKSFNCIFDCRYVLIIMFANWLSTKLEFDLQSMGNFLKGYLCHGTKSPKEGWGGSSAAIRSQTNQRSSNGRILFSTERGGWIFFWKIIFTSWRN